MRSLAKPRLRTSRFQRRRPGQRPRRCDANMKPPVFSSRAIRSTLTPASCRKSACRVGANSPPRSSAARPPAELAAVVLDRTERRTKSGSKMGILQLSDVSGHYEAILFQEGLTQYRDLLEKGAAVLVTLSAAVEGEDVRARIVAVEPLAAAAARAQKGLRVVVGDEGPLDGIKNSARRPWRRRGVDSSEARCGTGGNRNPTARKLSDHSGRRWRAARHSGRSGGRISVGSLLNLNYKFKY